MGKRILIAEDNYVLSFVYEKMVQRMHYNISSVAKTGEEALGGIRSENPDLVLMDIILKGSLNGIEVIEKVRENNNVPVIFLTAQSSEAIYRRIKAIGNASLAIKPVPYQELERKIRQFFN